MLINLFGLTNEGRIFNRDDQMKWVEFPPSDLNGYNTKKSAFWRLVKNIATHYYPENWYAHVAWTNLYKIAPWSGGNPDGRLIGDQQELCFKILEKEIQLLSPKYVIMLTSKWEWPFLFYLNRSKELNYLGKRTWGKYETLIYEIKGVKYILSPHPQGKSGRLNFDAIVGLMEDYS